MGRPVAEVLPGGYDLCMGQGKRRGSADLPLHSGRVPPWLADRMRDLGTAVAEALILEQGRRAFLERLSDPAWFQALGAVLGMDWHSSGITTSVMRALQRGLNERAGEMGVYILGGRGRYSRRTPAELLEAGSREGLDGAALAEASRLTAKIDNTCLQDGFQLYLHTFVLTREGEWAVVQQGMNRASGTARRYHWNSLTTPTPDPAEPELPDRYYFSDPHTAVAGPPAAHPSVPTAPGSPAFPELINLADTRAAGNRQGILDFSREHPDRRDRELMRLLQCRRISLPSRHQVRPEDIITPRLGAVLAAAWENPQPDFSGTLLMKGMGPRTVQALALVSEILYGAPSRFADPARFAFAHGGKDGHPHPVLTAVYDRSIQTLRRALDRAQIDRSSRLHAFRRLDSLTRWIQQNQAPEADVEALIRRERAQAPGYGGRTVQGGSVQGPPARQTPPGASEPRQGELF